MSLNTSQFLGLTCLFLAFPIAALSVTARYVPVSGPGAASAQGLAVDSAGNIFVLAAGGSAMQPQTCLFKLDPQQGNVQGQICFDQLTSPSVAVGPDGNPVVGGTTYHSDSVKLVSPLSSQSAPQQGYLIKFKADLSGITFATLFGGTRNTVLSALTVSQTGDIYMGGWTDGDNFPVTSGAFQSVAPTRAYPAWVAAISSAGERVLWSTLLGGPQPPCVNCNVGTAGLSSIAVDSSGAVVVAGAATDEQIPVTAGVIGPTCICAAGRADTFLARLSAGGSQLEWATYINHAVVKDLTLGTFGNNIIIGGSADTGFAATSGALQATFPGGAPTQDGIDYYSSAGYVAEISGDASHFLFATWIGGNNFQRPISSYGLGAAANGVTGVALGKDQTIWVTGASLPSELPLPVSTPILGSNYLIGLTEDGSRYVAGTTVPEGGADLAVAVSPFGPVGLGKSGSVLVPSPGTISLAGVTNSAGLTASGSVSPNELVSFYGSALGPSTAVSAEAVNGALPTSLDGVRVEFDGVAAPLLYAGPNQINAIVPSGVDGKSSTTVRIVTPNGELTGLVLAVTSAIPEVFAAPGPGNAAYTLNQDGTLNSATNPAAVGSVVAVWATGGGASGNPEADGAITGSSVYPLQLPLSVGIGFPGAVSIVPVIPVPPVPDVLYSGDAPSLVKGTMQINFRIPEAATPTARVIAYQFYLQVGTAYSDPFTVYVE